jgi:putative ABC transport system permease protein
MLRDLRYAAQGLRRSPAFTAAVTLSLGLAIGANAAIFGTIDALWLRPPGARAPGELVRIFSTSDAGREGLWSFAEFRELRDGARAFSGVAARGRRGTLVRLPDGATELQLVNVVSLDFFTTLGVTASVGRTFGPEDEQLLERTPAVVLGHDFWVRRYGGDPGIVGRDLIIGAGRLTVSVLGVLPPEFRDLEAAADRDLWIAPSTWALLNGWEEFEAREMRWFDIVARLRPGVAAQQAAADVDAWARRLALSYPATNRGRGARTIPELAWRLESSGMTAFALLGLVLLVMVITCVNVANLQLARAAARARELAVRTALGASRTRLLRQLMTENLLLGALGAAAGLLVASWVIQLLPGIIGSPPGFRAFTVFALDARVFTFTLAVTLLTTLAFGIAPSWSASRPDLVPVLKAGASPGRRRPGMRGGLVASQVAMAVVLLTAAGLFARSFDASRASPLGFSRKPVLMAWTLSEVPRAAADTAAARIRAIAGVKDVAVAIRSPLSLSGGGLARPVFVEGGDAALPALEVKYNAVGANYFSLMGTRVLEGRAFTEEDQRPGEAVVVVSQHFARRFFPGTPAVGRSIRVGAPDATPHRIVGIVENTVINAVGEEVEPYYYLPYWRGTYSEAAFLVELEQDVPPPAAEVRAALRGLDARYDPRLLATMDELVRYSTRTYRWTALLGGAMGVLGLMLTAIGVYGVVSFRTAARTREIGVRVALGADRRDVLGLVLRQGLWLTMVGVAAGVPLALVVARALASLLFGVGPVDLPSFAFAIAIVASIVIAATLVPARRALGVMPSVALRNE